MFGFTVLAVFINRNPIDRLALFVRAVGVSLVMLHVNAFVENLAETDRDRFQDAEQTVEQRRTEIRIVNEVVGNAVDVPGNADRIDEAEDEHDPKRNPRKRKNIPKNKRSGARPAATGMVSHRVKANTLESVVSRSGCHIAGLHDLIVIQTKRSTGASSTNHGATIPDFGPIDLRVLPGGDHWRAKELAAEEKQFCCHSSRTRPEALELVLRSRDVRYPADNQYENANRFSAAAS